MPRANGHRLPREKRQQAITALQALIAAGVHDLEACQQIAERYGVSDRTARSWLGNAYSGLAEEVDTDRRHLVGIALRRRRLVMARSAKGKDWKTYLAAAESEARLLGLDAPKQTEHHVLVAKAQDLSQVVIDTVRDHFANDPVGRSHFIQSLRNRLGAALNRRASASLPALTDGLDEAEDAPLLPEGGLEPSEPPRLPAGGQGDSVRIDGATAPDKEPAPARAKEAHQGPGAPGPASATSSPAEDNDEAP